MLGSKQNRYYEDKSLGMFSHVLSDASDSRSNVFDLAESLIPRASTNTELDSHASMYNIHFQSGISSKTFHHSIISVIKFVVMTQRMRTPYSAVMTVVKLFHYCIYCFIYLKISPNAYIQYHYKTNATCYAKERITRPPDQGSRLPLPL